jgi:precorrin-6B methylase 1
VEFELESASVISSHSRQDELIDELIVRMVRQIILASSRPSGEDDPKVSIMVDSG